MRATGHCATCARQFLRAPEANRQRCCLDCWWVSQLHDGRLLAVEVKGPHGRLRPEQKVVLTRVAAAGGVAFVARSLRDVVVALGPLDRVVALQCADRGACGSVGLFAASRCGA